VAKRQTPVDNVEAYEEAFNAITARWEETRRAAELRRDGKKRTARDAYDVQVNALLVVVDAAVGTASDLHREQVAPFQQQFRDQWAALDTLQEAAETQAEGDWELEDMVARDFADRTETLRREQNAITAAFDSAYTATRDQAHQQFEQNAAPLRQQLQALEAAEDAEFDQEMKAPGALLTAQLQEAKRLHRPNAWAQEQASKAKR
jgi:hypothetical protein